MLHAMNAKMDSDLEGFCCCIPQFSTEPYNAKSLIRSLVGCSHIKRNGASKLDHHWLPMIDKPGYVVCVTVHRAQFFHAVDSCGTIPTWSRFTLRAWQLAGSFRSNIANLIQSGTSPFSCGKARKKGFFDSESRASTPCCWDRLRECIAFTI